MNSIIFCEGRTDAVLLGQYLSKNKNWQYNSKGNLKLKLKEEDNSQIINKYKLQDNWVYIWGVGGRARFENPIKKVFEINNTADEPYRFEKIVILVDRDENETDRTISDEFSKHFKNLQSSGDWSTFSYIDEYNQEGIAKVMLLIIPFDEEGALESIMINSLNEDDKEALIPQCCSFVENLKTEMYLKKRRDRLKAKLSTIVSIICPDRAVDSLVEIVDGIDWCKYGYINNTFKKLLEI